MDSVNTTYFIYIGIMFKMISPYDDGYNSLRTLCINDNGHIGGFWTNYSDGGVLFHILLFRIMLPIRLTRLDK